MDFYREHFPVTLAKVLQRSRTNGRTIQFSYDTSYIFVYKRIHMYKREFIIEIVSHSYGSWLSPIICHLQAEELGKPVV